mgnify:CR=1 FL=1
MESCALNLMVDGKKHNHLHTPFKFIHCVAAKDSADNYEETATACAKEANFDDVAALMTCMKGPQGNALEHKQAQLIEALSPPHTYVPYLVVDGVHSDAIQNAVGSNLLGYVCQNYKGTNKAAACDQEFEFSTEDMEVCYKDDIFTKVETFLQ